MARAPHLRFGLLAREAGLSLLELMVATAIGLIGIVVITQTYIVNENYKRSTVSAGGAQTNGALALYNIERDVRMAGWGMAWSTVMGCSSMRWYYNGDYSNPPGGGLPTILPVPVVITDGGAGSDSITVMYGTQTERVIPATVSATMVSPGDPIQVDNPEGFSNNPGDLILGVTGTTCSMMQVTGISGGQLQHVSAGTAPFNPAGGGTLPTLPSGAQIFNLGRPVVNTYSVGTTTTSELQVASLFTATSSTVVPSYTPTPLGIVDGIIDLQAEYGKDNGVNNGTVSAASYVANDGIVDSYDNVTPTTQIGWQQVLSIRIGVLARSENYVKPGASGVCQTTTTNPTWGNGQSFPAVGDLTIATAANTARCYAYRVFETVVPLRNMIWRQG